MEFFPEYDRVKSENIGISSSYVFEEINSMLAVKLVLIAVITISMFFSLWKTLVSLVVPMACLWTYAWFTGFSAFSLTWLIVLTGVHILFQAVTWWLSNRYREANLAYTGAGITGFSTGILASLFLGSFLGFFMWWGLIGRLITEPVAIGVKPITRTFAGGALKLAYSTIASGVIAYMLF